MSEYTSYDFEESLNQTVPAKDVAECLAAHGVSDDGWRGGFLVTLKDGRFAYVSGWCDSTGWGCQDGAEVSYFDERPDLKLLDPDAQWDEAPANLNNWLKRLVRGHR